MKRRRRIKHLLTFDERLAEAAKRLRDLARPFPPAPNVTTCSVERGRLKSLPT
jgi:hypothetical protein